MKRCITTFLPLVCQATCDTTILCQKSHTQHLVQGALSLGGTFTHQMSTNTSSSNGSRHCCETLQKYLYGMVFVNIPFKVFNYSYVWTANSNIVSQCISTQFKRNSLAQLIILITKGNFSNCFKLDTYDAYCSRLYDCCPESEITVAWKNRRRKNRIKIEGIKIKFCFANVGSINSKFVLNL